MLDLYRLYHPDGKTLGTAISGLSGSGKTTIVISTLPSPKYKLEKKIPSLELGCSVD